MCVSLVILCLVIIIIPAPLNKTVNRTALQLNHPLFSDYLDFVLQFLNKEIAPPNSSPSLRCKRSSDGQVSCKRKWGLPALVAVTPIVTPQLSKCFNEIIFTKNC